MRGRDAGYLTEKERERSEETGSVRREERRKGRRIKSLETELGQDFITKLLGWI